MLTPYISLHQEQERLTVNEEGHSILGYAHCNAIYGFTIAGKEAEGARSLSFSSSTRPSGRSSRGSARHQAAIYKNCKGNPQGKNIITVTNLIDADPSRYSTS